MKVFVDKDILISGFLALLEVKVLGKVCFYKMFSSSVQIISPNIAKVSSRCLNYFPPAMFVSLEVH